ncbi:ankyrin repeat-containing domain protein [Xylariaceae sp. FL0662B]|nr:ankyrin repeat-containing domain protein [Xylariaceae sp. FL0662B]
MEGLAQGQLVPSRASLTGLPSELIWDLGDLLSPRDMSRLIRSCRLFFYILTQKLYKHDVLYEDSHALWWGVTNGDLPTIQRALDFGASASHTFTSEHHLSQCGGVQDTHLPVLVKAIRDGEFQLAQYLIREGADVNSPGRFRLICKVFYRHPLNFLLNGYWKRAPIKSQSMDDITDTIEAALKHGANPTEKDRVGFTPLYKAMGVYVPVKVVRLLLAHGAGRNDYQSEDAPWWNSISRISNTLDVRNPVEKFRLLIENIDKTHIRGFNRQYPSTLRRLIQQPCEKTSRFFEIILDRGADPNILDRSSTGWESLLDINVREIKSITKEDRGSLRRVNSTTARLKAAMEMFTMLLRSGANPNYNEQSTVQNLDSPLHVLCECSGDPSELVSEIIAYDAERNYKNADGCTPLHYACKTEMINTRTIEVLLFHGASVSAVDNEGMTPLHVACHTDKISAPHRLRIVKKLVDHGADLSMTDSENKTPLSYVADRDGDVAAFLQSRGG